MIAPRAGGDGRTRRSRRRSNTKRTRAEGLPVQRKKRVVIAAGALSLALIAAACGGDDSKDNASATTAAGGATTTAAPATTAASGATTSTTAGPEPQSIEDWEALWATQRAAIVKRITDN